MSITLPWHKVQNCILIFVVLSTDEMLQCIRSLMAMAKVAGISSLISDASPLMIMHNEIAKVVPAGHSVLVLHATFPRPGLLECGCTVVVLRRLASWRSSTVKRLMHLFSPFRVPMATASCWSLSLFSYFLGCFASHLSTQALQEATMAGGCRYILVPISHSPIYGALINSRVCYMLIGCRKHCRTRISVNFQSSYQEINLKTYSVTQWDIFVDHYYQHMN